MDKNKSQSKNAQRNDNNRSSQTTNSRDNRSDNNRQFLEDAKYPASRDDLVNYARQQGASTEDISELRNIDDRQYRSFDEVQQNMRARA